MFLCCLSTKFASPSSELCVEVDLFMPMFTQIEKSGFSKYFNTEKLMKR